MGTTTDPKDPRLTHGVDAKPVDQAEVYLVLSADERAKGFVRPVRRSYIHVGIPDCVCTDSRFKHALSFEGKKRVWGACTDCECEKFQLDDSTWSGCQRITTMARDIAETYARRPSFYGATYCATCRRHLAIEEFLWEADRSPLGS